MEPSSNVFCLQSGTEMMLCLPGNFSSSTSPCMPEMIPSSFKASSDNIRTAVLHSSMTSAFFDETVVISTVARLICSLVADCCSAAMAMERTCSASSKAICLAFSASRTVIEAFLATSITVLFISNRAEAWGGAKFSWDFRCCDESLVLTSQVSKKLIDYLTWQIKKIERAVEDTVQWRSEYTQLLTIPEILAKEKRIHR